MVHAARSRCGACLSLPAARRGCCGVGAVSDSTGQGMRTLRRAVGLCVHGLPRRARCCAGFLDACVGWRAGRGWCGAHGAMGSLCGAQVPHGYKLSYPHRRAPRRFPTRCMPHIIFSLRFFRFSTWSLLTIAQRRSIALDSWGLALVFRIPLRRHRAARTAALCTSAPALMSWGSSLVQFLATLLRVVSAVSETGL